MTGLEKILKHIEEDAAQAADQIISDANKKAQEITQSAKNEAEKKRLDMKEQSENNVKAYLSRAESSALLQEKKIILEAKQKIINNVIAHAQDKLINLPVEEYIDVILKMVQKYAQNQSGHILFSATDMKRLPKDLEATLNKALIEKEGAALTISEETRNLVGGFVLVYGDIEENCSFDALFFAARETLQDKVCALLFE